MTATSCPLIPTQSYVALLLEAAPQHTPSGIFIPHSRNPFATVIAVGPDCESVSAGDRVAFRRWTTEVTVDGETYLLVDEDDLLATIA